MDTPAQYARVAEIYAEVFDLAGDARAARLAELCGGDAALRGWVEELLTADESVRTGDHDPLAELAAAVRDAPAATPRLATGSIAAGRYRIEALAGRGGAGEVYVARDLLVEQTVALKFLSRRLREGGRAEALLHELRLARRVRHPNVCQIFDVGEAEGERFLTMEYVRGDDLAGELERRGRFAPSEALRLAHQLCAGLAAIHQQGIVHGDLKPANIVLDERGDARIVDFGISEARAWHPDGAPVKGDPRALMGTPAYVAPERWRGAPASVASDLYALGLVLYEVFGGRRAIEADSLADFRERHAQTWPPPLSTLAEGVDPRVEAIVERCLAKEPGERPATAVEVARALPGGDVLGGLALAGVLPTAERVAEGGGETPLARPAVSALALLFVVLLAAAARLLPGAHLVEGSNLPREPAALAERAALLLDEIGGRAPASIAYGFGTFGEPPELLFWYRTSPRPLAATAMVTLLDPPLTEPGMVALLFEPTGALRSLVAVGTGAFAGPADFALSRAALFREAGLEVHDFEPGDWWTGFVGRGRAEGWQARSGGVRVSAADEDGRPVYFEAVAAAREPLWVERRSQPRHRRVLGPLAILIALLSLPLTGVLAWRHWRSGSVDRLGARRTTLAVLLLALAHGFTDLVNGGAGVARLPFALGVLQSAALFTLVTWILYAALEPVVRRYWPHGLVSWARLVRGRFDDPILGRDVLVGACLGCLAVLLDALRVMTAERFGAASPLIPTPEQLLALAGPWGALGALLAAALGAIVLAWIQFALLAALTRACDRDAVVLVPIYAAVLAAGATALGGDPWWSAGFQFAFWLIATPVIVRFGFTAMASTAFVFLALTNLPTTLDPTQWYFPTSVAGFALLLALAAFAARAALGGRDAP